MINWDAPCQALNCEHLYYVYGCEAECALKKICDKLEKYRSAYYALQSKTCDGCRNTCFCHMCSRNYEDMYKAQ